MPSRGLETGTPEDGMEASPPSPAESFSLSPGDALIPGPGGAVYSFHCLGWKPTSGEQGQISDDGAI